METLTLVAAVAASIVLEAASVLLVGSLLGALVHVLVPDSALRRPPRSRRSPSSSRCPKANPLPGEPARPGPEADGP